MVYSMQSKAMYKQRRKQIIYFYTHFYTVTTKGGKFLNNKL